MATNRQAIVEALVTLLKTIDGSEGFFSNLNGQVYPRMKFLEEFKSTPAVCVFTSSEIRVYQAANYSDKYLTIKIVVFIDAEDALARCDEVLSDIEGLLDNNQRLGYVDKSGTNQTTHDISVVSIDTDEGTLDPISIGEMLIRVHY